MLDYLRSLQKDPADDTSLLGRGKESALGRGDGGGLLKIKSWQRSAKVFQSFSVAQNLPSEINIGLMLENFICILFLRTAGSLEVME